MNIISTEKAPGAIGPYSQGYTVGGLVFTSGQIPIDPATGAVAEGIAAQADQSCRNVGAILEAAGVGFDKVVKTTCFLADIADFAAFNEVYARYFTSKPARSCVAVKDLPKGVLCEIEAIRLPGGAPAYRFSGRSAQWVEARRLRAHLSLSHEDGMAMAYCILETET